MTQIIIQRTEGQKSENQKSEEQRSVVRKSENLGTEISNKVARTL